MFGQLGNIIFETMNAPESLSHSDNTTYATHNLVSGKPRLQPVANELEEISLSIKLRVEYANPAEDAIDLKNAKDNFAVMPFVMGNGQYLGDYVIVSISKSINQCLEDGTVIESVLQLSLKEFVSPDKLQQQQQAARKKAFAVNKIPVNRGLKPSVTPAQIANLRISQVLAESKSVDGQVLNYEHNTSQQAFISSDIKASLNNIIVSASDYKNKIDELNDQQNAFMGDYNTMLLAYTQMKNAVNAFTIPVTSLALLQANNNILQNACTNLRAANNALSVNVITRRI